MKWGQIVLVVLGAALGALCVVWLVYDRRVPTLRFSHTLGRGNEVAVEWIRIK